MNRKLRRNLLNFVLNISIFWIFFDILPFAEFRYHALGQIIAGFGFTLALVVGDMPIVFFKLPKIWISHLISRTIFVYAYLWAIDTYVPAIMKLGPSYLGGLDLVLFNIPKLISLPNIYLVLAFSAPFLVICSIIFEKLKK